MQWEAGIKYNFVINFTLIITFSPRKYLFIFFRLTVSPIRESNAKGAIAWERNIFNLPPKVVEKKGKKKFSNNEGNKCSAFVV